MACHPAQTAYHRAQMIFHRAQMACHRAQTACHRVQMACHRIQTACHHAQTTCHPAQMACHRVEMAYHRAQMTCHRVQNDSYHERMRLFTIAALYKRALTRFRTTDWQGGADFLSCYRRFFVNLGSDSKNVAANPQQRIRERNGFFATMVGLLSVFFSYPLLFVGPPAPQLILNHYGFLLICSSLWLGGSPPAGFGIIHNNSELSTLNSEPGTPICQRLRVRLYFGKLGYVVTQF